MLDTVKIAVYCAFPKEIFKKINHVVSTPKGTGILSVTSWQKHLRVAVALCFIGSGNAYAGTTPQTIVENIFPSSLSLGATVSMLSLTSSGLPLRYVSRPPLSSCGVDSPDLSFATGSAVCSIVPLPASVCTVSAAGVVTAISPGNCQIFAIQDGNDTFAPATQELDFEILPLGSWPNSGPILNSIIPVNLEVGGSTTLNITDGSGAKAQYTMGVPGVCNVSTDGTVYAIGPGQCIITALAGGILRESIDILAPSTSQPNIGYVASTLLDNATGLEWMPCPLGQELDFSITPLSCRGTAIGYTWDEANALNGKVVWHGTGGWRLPNIRELLSLVNWSRAYPAIDLVGWAGIYPDTTLPPDVSNNQVTPLLPSAPVYGISGPITSGSPQYNAFNISTELGPTWSSTPVANYSIFNFLGDAFGEAYSVDFSRPSSGPNLRGARSQVRLVRDSAPPNPKAALLSVNRPSSDYNLLYGGTVVHHNPSGVTWKRCVEGKAWSGSTCIPTGTTPLLYTWDETRSVGYPDYRLPTQEELLSLTDYNIAPVPNINDLAQNIENEGQINREMFPMAGETDWTSLGTGFLPPTITTTATTTTTTTGPDTTVAGFGLLGSYGFQAKSNTHNVRLVMSETALFTSFTVNVLSTEIPGVAINGIPGDFPVTGYGDFGRSVSVGPFSGSTNYKYQVPAGNKLTFIAPAFTGSGILGFDTFFTGWSGCDSSSDYYCTINMTSDRLVTVNYSDNPTPNPPTAIIATAGGSQAMVSFTPPRVTSGLQIYKYTVTANPGGATAVGTTSPITVTGLTSGTSYSFTVTASTYGNTSVPSSASNSVIPTAGATTTYTVTPSAGSNGSLSPASPQTVNSGATTTFSVTAASGYQIASVSGCGGTLSGSTFTTGAITGACTVSASFSAMAPTTFTVTPSTGGNGTVSCTSPVSNGATSTCTVSPASGYQLATFTDNGVDKIGAVAGGGYSIANVTANHSVTATFSLIPPAPVIGPSGDINGDGIVDVGDALLALRIAVQLVPMDPKYLINGDVAPMVNGHPQPDGVIDVGDALLILRKCVQLITW